MAPKLGAAGLKLWKEITADYELRVDELRVLEAACREADIIALMETERDKVTFRLIVKGSMGQDVINPVIPELRQHMATQATLLSKLKLSDDAAGTRATSARRAANARWTRPA